MMFADDQVSFLFLTDESTTHLTMKNCFIISAIPTDKRVTTAVWKLAMKTGYWPLQLIFGLCEDMLH